jgi:hypothetical protein
MSQLTRALGTVERAPLRVPLRAVAPRGRAVDTHRAAQTTAMVLAGGRGELGHDLEKDAQRFTVTDRGVVVVPRGTVVRV